MLQKPFLYALMSIFACSTLAANAQAPAGPVLMPKDMSLAEVRIKCGGMTIVKIDDQWQCSPYVEPAIIDNLSAIIADLRKHDLENDPIQAGSEGDREALRHMPDASAMAHAKSARYYRSLLNRYKALETPGIQGENLLNHQLLGFVLGQNLLLSNFDTSRLPFTNDSGFFNSMSYISRQTKFEKIDDYEAYAARLSELPRFFKQHQTNMQRGMRTNYTASADILPGIIEMVSTLANGKAQEHAFFKPFAVYPDIITKQDQSRLLALGLEAINKSVIPAYKDLQKFLETEYAPKARKKAGIGTSQQTRDYYKALVKYFTTLEITPDEVHELGLSEVQRIRGEMDAIIKETGFEGSFKEFLNFMRTDEQFYAKTPEELLKEAAWIAKRIDGQMPRYFGKLPRLPYGVMAVPKEIAPNYTTGRYWGGNLANGLAGNYVVNTYDLSQRPLYNLPALTLHEGVPGHHHQISLAQELKDVPEFRQSLYPNSFGEGWGLYSEKLGVEMGIYTTPYENFGRLTYEMWRACRLVVDTGMHWKGWSREQAEQCFFENSALAPHNIKTEVDRYISWPGQALSYKIGELKILELRKRAELTLGENFDIRGFHDAVLGNGGIPLDILEERINAWIADKKPG